MEKVPRLPSEIWKLGEVLQRHTVQENPSEMMLK